ncbi:MAG: DinB family protein [Acidobacteriota bacterium]
MLARLLRQFDYDRWANLETLAALERAGEPPPRAVMRFGHLLAAQHLWLARLNREAAPMAVWPRFAVAECAALLRELPALWGAWLEEAGDQGLAETIAYVNSQGRSFANPAADILEHVLLHSAYHRGQIASDLRTAGAEPPTTDFIHWARAVEPRR